MQGLMQRATGKYSKSEEKCMIAFTLFLLWTNGHNREVKIMIFISAFKKSSYLLLRIPQLYVPCMRQFQDVCYATGHRFPA
jgi:hypothetical protein